jgi:hypothetical protein
VAPLSLNRLIIRSCTASILKSANHRHTQQLVVRDQLYFSCVLFRRIDYLATMSTTKTDDTSMSSSAANGPAPAYEPDENWEDCSLCDEGESCFDNERVPLPDREALTADMEAFLQHVQRVKDEPRVQGETFFNEKFWVFVKNTLELVTKPLGYTDMGNRYQAMQKGPGDNGAFIGKYIGISPLNPIYPNVVAEMAGLPLNDVLTELLYASTTGMVSMRFSPFCERCGSPTCAQTGIIDNAKLPIMAYCRTCRFTNPIDCMEKIKVVFTLNSDVLYVLAENLPCKPSKYSLSLSEIYAMVPATFSGSGFRFSFGCDGEMALRPALNAGKYRMVSLFFLVNNTACVSEVYELF